MQIEKLRSWQFARKFVMKKKIRLQGLYGKNGFKIPHIFLFHKCMKINMKYCDGKEIT
jgi:hypothetical protein